MVPITDIEELPLELTSVRDSAVHSTDQGNMEDIGLVSDDTRMMVNVAEYNELVNRLKGAEQRLALAEDALQTSASDIVRMR